LTTNAVQKVANGKERAKIVMGGREESSAIGREVKGGPGGGGPDCSSSGNSKRNKKDPAANGCSSKG